MLPVELPIQGCANQIRDDPVAQKPHLPGQRPVNCQDQLILDSDPLSLEILPEIILLPLREHRRMVRILVL